MLDRLRVIFGGFDWTDPNDRERRFRSSIATDARARAFSEWYFTFNRVEPGRALGIIVDARF